MWGHEEVDVFEDVQEELVPPVLDALPPPPDLPRDLRRDGRLLLPARRLDALLRDERLQDARVRVLRVPKVQQLVQQLVDEHKVVLHVLLGDLAEVGLHDVAHLEQELKDHGGVHVLLGDGRQPDVGALDVEEGGAGDVGHGRADLLAGVDHVHPERVHRVATDVIPERRTATFLKEMVTRS